MYNSSHVCIRYFDKSGKCNSYVEYTIVNMLNMQYQVMHKIRKRQLNKDEML